MATARTKIAVIYGSSAGRCDVACPSGIHCVGGVRRVGHASAPLACRVAYCLGALRHPRGTRALAVSANPCREFLRSARRPHTVPRSIRAALPGRNRIPKPSFRAGCRLRRAGVLHQSFDLWFSPVPLLGQAQSAVTCPATDWSWKSECSVAVELAELHRNIRLFSAAIHGHIDGISGAAMIENPVDIELVGDFLAVDGYNDIASNVEPGHAREYNTISAADAGLSRGSALGGHFDQQTFLHGQIQRLAEPAGDRDRLNAEDGPVHAAGADEVIGDIFCGVDRDSEANACRGSAGCVDCRINADHVAMRIDQRTAGIPAVDGRIGLDRFFNGRGLGGAYGSANGADHAGCERRLKAKWVADGQNFLSYLNAVGVPKLQGGELLSSRVNLDERNIIALVGANGFRRVARLISQDHFDGLRSFDDVVVRENVAARINDETGPRTLDRYRFHEEVVLGRFGEDVGHRRRGLAVDAHVDGFVLGQSRVARVYRR